MAKSVVCDLCNRPCEFIAAKLFYSKKKPIGQRKRDRSDHGDYSHHLDIGPCCSERVMTLFKWTPRKKRNGHK